MWAAGGMSAGSVSTRIRVILASAQRASAVAAWNTSGARGDSSSATSSDENELRGAFVGVRSMLMSPGAPRASASRRRSGAGARLAISRNITGTRNSDSTVDDVSPPTTASASGWFDSVPASRPSAVGSRPMTVARLVIAIGMKRVRAAATTASSLSAPSLKRRLASSISRMPFETAMPTTIRTPMSAVIEKPCPAAISARTMPSSDTGIVNSMMNGSRSDLNCDAMIMNTTMTARPDGEPEAREGRAHQVDLTDEAEVDVAGARDRRAASARARAAALPMSRPSVCISTCATRCRWLRSMAIGPDRAADRGRRRPASRRRRCRRCAPGRARARSDRRRRGRRTR